MFFFFFSTYVKAQDSIPAAIDLTEEKELKFQQFFFKALSQKSIGNYQKAIENLESCNQILPNNLTVFFEFSKNYLKLNNTLLAKEYINRAIKQEDQNVWMQKHLVSIFVKERNFSEAIKIQKKIVLLNAKERETLVRLYLQNNDYKNALNLLAVLENDNSISSNLIRIKESLENRKNSKVKKTVSSTNNDIFKKFETDKSYLLLKQVLESTKDKPEELLKYSNEGISLFPAQPFVYLMNAKAFNSKQEYEKAIQTLKNGIDFVIEDEMEAKFYKEMSLSYKGLGNKIEEKKYSEKFKKLNK